MLVEVAAARLPSRGAQARTPVLAKTHLGIHLLRRWPLYDRERMLSSFSAMSVSFCPSIGSITSTRQYIEGLLGPSTSLDASSRVALTVHELLENTLKYSSDGRASIDVALEHRDGKRRLEVRATNRTSDQRLSELSNRIDALREAADPMDLYVATMRATAQRAGSGLGLMRIRVEAEMQLSYEVEGDRVTICASTTVE
jgi:anti-sigma regulatory factor (Ser/Thr protein kinase)